MSNTKTIARNTGWFGLESIISAVVTLVTSIAIARTLGPSKTGYIICIIWVALVVANLGGIGIPATTQKYMAELLGMGDRGTARHIYFRPLQLQIAMATLATIGLFLWVLIDASEGYQLASALVVAKITFASALASLAAHYVAVHLTPMLAILCGGTAALIVLFVFFYLMRVLEREDRARFSIHTGMMPKSIVGTADKILSLLIRAQFAGATPTEA